MEKATASIENTERKDVLKKLDDFFKLRAESVVNLTFVPKSCAIVLDITPDFITCMDCNEEDLNKPLFEIYQNGTVTKILIEQFLDELHWSLGTTIDQKEAENFYTRLLMMGKR